MCSESMATDHWGPAGPGNTFLRNGVQTHGIIVRDHSHDQIVFGNVLAPDAYYNNLVVDESVLNTLVHGNYDDGAVQWDPVISDHTIPDSYYLAFVRRFSALNRGHQSEVIWDAR